jgi:hypothetical protein
MCRLSGEHSYVCDYRRDCAIHPADMRFSQQVYHTLRDGLSGENDRALVSSQALNATDARLLEATLSIYTILRRISSLHIR